MLRIRLTRRGAKKSPYYRVVVTEKSSPRDGRFKEIVGHYNPAQEPVQLRLDLERVDHWVKIGAQPTRTVKTLIKRVRAQGQSVDATVEKVAETESLAEPEKVAAKEPQEKAEKVSEETLQADAEEVTEGVKEEPLQAEAGEVAEEVKEETSQEEPEKVVEKAPPTEA